MSTSPIVEFRDEESATVLYLVGAWRLRNVAHIVHALRDVMLPDAARLVLDGSRLESIDTAGCFILFKQLEELGKPVADVESRGFEHRHERLIELVRGHIRPREWVAGPKLGILARVGAITAAIIAQTRSVLAFIGRVTVELLELLRHPSLFRPRETVAQFQAVCIDAIPIVVLVNFLIGVVVAYVLGVEAERYGASLFVADGIALAVCRELSPILGSVLVAGRSGAAFTAEIGTMKVEEEIDAIATLGLSPIQVLVIPRLIAIAFALPLLVLVGDFAGVMGGMFVGASKLHIPPNVFLDRVHTMLEMRHFLVGIGKAPVFALFISMIACRLGLAVKGDARSVGVNTTSTVVQCIVWVFVLDAAFAVLLQRLGV